MDDAEQIRLQGLFLHAARSGDVPLAESLIDQSQGGAVQFLTPDMLAEGLREASYADHADMVYLVIAAGAPLDQGDDQNFTAIDFAALNGNVELVRTLLDAGAKGDVVDTFGLTPSMNAGQRGNDPEAADAVRKVLDKYKAMNNATSSMKTAKKTVFSSAYYWQNQVNNPRFWRKADEAFTYFAEQDDPITLADLKLKNTDGVNWLQRASECRAMGTVLSHLNAQGECVRSELLLTKEGEASPLLLNIAKTRQLPALFTTENWDGASAAEIRAVYNAVPEEWRGQVKNLQTLTLDASRQQRQERAAMRAVG